MSDIYVIHWSCARCFGHSIPAGSGEASAVRHIVGGHVEGTIERIDCYDTDEDWARVVTEDVARAVANHYEAHRDEAMSPEVRDFIETHAGLAYARGLPVADRSFAAA